MSKRKVIRSKYRSDGRKWELRKRRLRRNRWTVLRYNNARAVADAFFDLWIDKDSWYYDIRVDGEPLSDEDMVIESTGLDDSGYRTMFAYIPGVKPAHCCGLW